MPQQMLFPTSPLQKRFRRRHGQITISTIAASAAATPTSCCGVSRSWRQPTPAAPSCPDSDESTAATSEPARSGGQEKEQVPARVQDAIQHIHGQHGVGGMGSRRTNTMPSSMNPANVRERPGSRRRRRSPGRCRQSRSQSPGRRRAPACNSPGRHAGIRRRWRAARPPPAPRQSPKVGGGGQSFKECAGHYGHGGRHDSRQGRHDPHFARGQPLVERQQAGGAQQTGQPSPGKGPVPPGSASRNSSARAASTPQRLRTRPPGRRYTGWGVLGSQAATEIASAPGQGGEEAEDC